MSKILLKTWITKLIIIYFLPRNIPVLYQQVELGTITRPALPDFVTRFSILVIVVATLAPNIQSHKGVTMQFFGGYITLEDNKRNYKLEDNRPRDNLSGYASACKKLQMSDGEQFVSNIINRSLPSL
jgi:hypothetical protein